MNLIESIVNNGHGSLNPQYLFIHETANPGAPAINHKMLYSRGYEFAVHYVSDWTGDVYHCMPDDRLAYAVGNGNPYGVSLEICHATNKDDFAKTWKTAVEFAAYYLKKRGWGIDRMMSHNECRIKWGGTTHTDPDSYFNKYGKSWDDFKKEVSAAMNGAVVPSPTTTSKNRRRKMECIFQPNGENYLVFYNGNKCCKLTHPDQVTAINMVYKNCTGNDIPTFALGSKNAPWATRFMDAVKG